MRFEIIGKNISVTDAMREAIEKKLNGLDKYLLIDKDTVARVVVRVYPNTDKLEDQIRRQKTRLTRRHKDSLAQSFLLEIENEEENDIPVKTKTIHADKMDLDEAIMQMELSGHDFYIYTDEETDSISVVYIRKDGSYGLIETK